MTKSLGYFYFGLINICADWMYSFMIYTHLWLAASQKIYIFLMLSSYMSQKKTGKIIIVIIKEFILKTTLIRLVSCDKENKIKKWWRKKDEKYMLYKTNRIMIAKNTRKWNINDLLWMSNASMPAILFFPHVLHLFWARIEKWIRRQWKKKKFNNKQESFSLSQDNILQIEYMCLYFKINEIIKQEEIWIRFKKIIIATLIMIFFFFHCI